MNKIRLVISLCASGILFSCSTGNSTESLQADSLESKKEITLYLLKSYKTGEIKSSSAEIVSYDPDSKRLFVVNSIANKLDILNFSKPSDIHTVKSLSMDEYGSTINSVAVKNKIVAVAVDAKNPLLNGSVVFFDTEGTYLNKLTTGVRPDMLTFTPDGKNIVIACEGEPNDDYSVDPEGSITIINLSNKISSLTQKEVYTIDFKSYNDSLDVLRKRGVRIFGPKATVAQDLEPEYAAISADSRTAWITLQENNAVAIVDVQGKFIRSIAALDSRGFEVSSARVPALSCPVKGIFQPDGITSFNLNGKTYLVTANEGDVRHYEGFKEIIKLGSDDYKLDEKKYPASTQMKDKENLGKLNVNKYEGDLDGDGDIDEIFCYGSRSFSIWDSSMTKLYDSGDDFKKIACENEQYCKFNERFEEIKENNKLDNRGPEPESVVTGKIGKNIYAFITLERYGGVMVYNITDPVNPYFIQYINSNEKGSEAESRPEGILFIPASNSPSGKNMVIVANEGTSVIDIYEIKVK
ncbi:MAG: choice-of-anchor I family protein [Cytophagaceae bacterium]|nr:choice-of-anchor I family protein [Cytophagaceae bacterium]